MLRRETVTRPKDPCAGPAPRIRLEAGASGRDSRLLFRLHRAGLNEIGRSSAFLDEGTELE
jgi:hypothetical protein